MNLDFYALSIFLIGAGLAGIFLNRDFIKILVSISVLESGVNLLLISIGYVQGRLAPILFSQELKTSAVGKVVDPIPQALVLTAIVIGLGLLAFGLSLAIWMAKNFGTTDVSELKGLRG